MKLAVLRPSFLSFQSSGAVLDEDALLASLTRDGKSWNPTVSAEGYISVSGEYLEIGSDTLQKDSVIQLDAESYNSLKTTRYNLPRSVVLTRTDIPMSLSISRL